MIFNWCCSFFCSRIQQQSGQTNGGTRRNISPPGPSDSDDSDISLGGTSPQSPSSTPPPSNHQPSPVPPIGPVTTLQPPALNFRFDAAGHAHQLRLAHATAFKFPATAFHFGQQSPQASHPSIPNPGGLFRLTDTSPFQAVGPRDDLSR